MSDLRVHIRIALCYFTLAGVLGLLLRAFPTIAMPINYRFVVHTHSHIALLGWVYLALTTLIYKLFVKSPVTDRKYLKLFWFTQLTLAGMLFSFPFQGYALFSIIFSTLFLFASYGFFWFFLKNVKPTAKLLPSFKCIRAALWFMVVSSLGPWALGIIMNTLGPQSAWYRLAIYFYLHFLYNGFMILALVGLFLYLLEQRQIILPPIAFQNFFWAFNLAIILSFFLSTLFTTPPLFLNFLGGTGALLQIWAVGILLKAGAAHKDRGKALFSPFQQMLFKTTVVFLAAKMLLQLLTAFPYFADLAAVYLDFTIAYLHWTFLGVITIGLFLLLNLYGLLGLPEKVYFIYLTGFILTETLMVYKGIVSWQGFPLFHGYSEALAAASAVIVAGILSIFITHAAKGGSEPGLYEPPGATGN